MSRSIPILKLPVRLSLELLLIVAIATGILLRIIYLGSREFWYDEVLSLLVSTGQKVNYDGPRLLPVALRDYTALLNVPGKASAGDIIETIKNIFKSLVSDVHPPLLFQMLHFWVRIFGNSEAAVRGLVALSSVAAIGSAYGLGRVVLGHRGGLLLAALLSTNPYYLSHSLNARMYAPLILWTILSSWAMLELIGRTRGQGDKGSRGAGGVGELGELGGVKYSNFRLPTGRVLHTAPLTDFRLVPHSLPLLWNVVLVGSVAAGLLTQYVFVYWVISLGIFVLIYDRHRWWQHGLRLGTGVLLTLPWVLWGTKQQLRNRGGSISQISEENGLGVLNHLQNIAQTLGSHLLLGDWATSLPEIIVALAGSLIILLLAFWIISLWQRGERRSLGMVLLLGIFPLLLATTVDVVTKKSLVGFGWGRAIIFILPGCLLLLALWLERASGRWRGPAAVVLLLLYLSISIGDFNLRQRLMFHQVADLIQQDPNVPTLIVMNSNAWGHVLRLAYYIPSTAPVMLLAQGTKKLIPALEKTLKNEALRTSRLIWLDSAKPVWGPPSTSAEKQQIQQLLTGNHFQQAKTHQLSGTMIIDEFTVNLFTRPAT